LLGFLGQGLTLLNIARTVMEEIENHALLPQPRYLGDLKIREVEIGAIMPLDKPGVLFNVGKIEHKKQVVRFEVPKLQDEVYPRLARVELFERRLFRRHKYKILQAFVVSKVRPPVQRFNFVIP